MNDDELIYLDTYDEDSTICFIPCFTADTAEDERVI